MRTNLPTGTSAEIASSDHPTRGVVVVPDIMGLRPLFDDLVAHLAERTTGPSPRSSRSPGASRCRSKSAWPRWRPSTTSARSATSWPPLICSTSSRVAVLGFCMGGMYTMKAVATGRFDRAAPFYGMIRVPDAWRSRRAARRPRSSRRRPGLGRARAGDRRHRRSVHARRGRRRARSRRRHRRPLRRRRARVRARPVAVPRTGPTTPPTRGAVSSDWFCACRDRENDGLTGAQLELRAGS